MKADLPLDERKRLEDASQREIRAALVRRHVEVTADKRSVEKALNQSATLAMHALAAAKDAAPALTKPPVPTTVAPPAPSADLRSALGLT